jgi:DNA invertase Pin-like site-specific DNA recombinase
MPAHQGKFVAYFRVSTDKQGKSGLGLEAQREAVNAYLNGGRWSLVQEFVEVESGKRNDRPELAAALAACKKHKAKLIIAKLDRLSRNLAFIATLMDSSVEFVAVDNPHANKLTIHILAAVAQHEREMIGQRTRDALKAAKARGKKLGNPKLAEARKRAVQGNKSSAARYAANLLPIIREIQASGIKSLRGVARALAARGVATARGGAWTPVQVSAILHRAPSVFQATAKIRGVG